MAWAARLRSWLDLLSGSTQSEGKGLQKARGYETARSSLAAWLAVDSNRSRLPLCAPARPASLRASAPPPHWDELLTALITYVSRLVCQDKR